MVGISFSLKYHIIPFNMHLMNVYLLPATVLGTGESGVNIRNKKPSAC